MNFEDVLNIYHLKRQTETGFNFIGEIFQEIKEQYLAETTAKDKNQSWNAWSGKALEKLIEYSIKEFIETCGYPVALTSYCVLKRKKLSDKLETVKKNIAVSYAKAPIVPNVDLILYDQNSCQVISLLFCQASLRERVVQAAYWKIKLGDKQIRCYLVSTDNEQDFVQEGQNSSRNRIIVEHGEIDGAYIFGDIPESGKIKKFDRMFPDLTSIFKGWFDSKQNF
jgi:hypothetical protein